MKNIARFVFLSIISAFALNLTAYAEFDPALYPKKNAKVSTKAESCRKGVSSAELNINNVRARINIGGNMWLNGLTPAYYIPASGTSTSLFCGALWIGGRDQNGQTRVAAMQFGQYGEDFWPGPVTVDGDATTNSDGCSKWDKHFIITKDEVKSFVAACERDENGNIISGPSDASAIPDIIRNWPAKGESGMSNYIAPFYDANNDGEYNVENGDYPYYDLEGNLCPSLIKAQLPLGVQYTPERTMEQIWGTGGSPLVLVTGSMLTDQVLKGDQTIFWVFNDKGNAHTESKSDNPIGLEIRAQAFAFTTNDEINNMTFYSYEIINRSTSYLKETYFSQWVDADLGFSEDDYVGCDVKRGLGYCYNGKAVDGPGTAAYTGNPPAVGIDFFQGPYMDPDEKDNPKVDLQGYIAAVQAAGSPQAIPRDNRFYQYVNNFERFRLPDTIINGTTQIRYDEPAISLYSDLFFNEEDGGVWYFKRGDELGNCAINGVNFGNGIVDDERFGMRRFVYYTRLPGTTLPNNDPAKASDYYNYLRGVWKDNRRMVFGGNAVPGTTGVTNVECDFMFPGNSDPWNWGTNGVVPNTSYSKKTGWTEETAGNAYGDRRFMQSAGPFTLQPGAVNYVTVGIPWAQAPTGGPMASVELLRRVDDKCQSLFDNCFIKLEGPEAPTVVAQELNNEIILYLDYKNPQSNNYKESYNRIDPTIPRFSENASDIKDSTVYYSYKTDPTTGKIDTLKYIEYTYNDIENDQYYHFEGYQIYQLANKNVSIADIQDPAKVRLVAQCDIKNFYDAPANTQPISRLINYEQNPLDNSLTPYVWVDGANQGIQHTFSIKEDKFPATGSNTKLVNNKAYYYVVVAYAQNRYKAYNPNDPSSADGQKKVYLASDRTEMGDELRPIVVIPHDPSSDNGGTIIQAEYGTSPIITRLEGRGNGGILLELKEESLDQIRNTNFAEQLTYEKNAGPVNVRIVDPLNVKPGNFIIQFTGGENGDSTWFLTCKDGNGNPIAVYTDDNGNPIDTVFSDAIISKGYEQLILELGISIKIEQGTDIAKIRRIENAHSISADPFLLPKTNDYSGFSFRYNSTRWNGPVVQSSAILGASIEFSNPEVSWLTGLKDDAGITYSNWIRAGQNFQANAMNLSYYTANTYSQDDSLTHMRQDYLYFDTSVYQNDGTLRMSANAIDMNNETGKILNGTWAPYRLVSCNSNHPAFSPYYYASPTNNSKTTRLFADPITNYSLNFNEINNVYSVNIYFTTDTNLWTRCPVIEMCEDENLSYGNARKFQLRKSPSVDKMGKSLNDGTYGMGWFPGYAINVETGERLYIFFGEDSRYIEYKGQDMIWNPSSVVSNSAGTVLGGKHFIYVLGSNGYNYSFDYSLTGRVTIKGSSPSYMGTYDSLGVSKKETFAGQWLYNKLKSLDMVSNLTNTGDPDLSQAYEVFINVMWVGIPLVTSSELEFDNPMLMKSDATVKLRVRKSYLPYSSNSGKQPSMVKNDNNPMYGFAITSDMVTLTGQAAKNSNMKNSIMDKIAVVPNPYYAASSFETSQLDSRIRITNLPAGSVVTIYTLDGNIVRKFNPTSQNQPNLNYMDGKDTKGSQTTLDWDLKNHKGIPIAGGTYLIYIKSPGIGDKIIKWFGVISPTDLNSYN